MNNSYACPLIDSEMVHPLTCWPKHWTTFALICKAFEISVSPAIHATLSFMQQIYWDQVSDRQPDVSLVE